MPKQNPVTKGGAANGRARDARLDRVNKHLLATHFETEIYRDFKVLAAEQLQTTDALLHEAVALLLAAYKRPLRDSLLRKLKAAGLSKNIRLTKS